MRNFPAEYNLQDNDVLYFSHIPKTAGMTFRTIVEDQFRAEEICPATLNAQVAKIPAEQIATYRLFRGHLGFINIPKLVPGKQIVNVTVLREPIARVVSHYEYIRRMPGDPHYRAVKDMTLEEFAQKLTAGKVGKNIQTYHVAKTMRFNLDSLTPTEILELAKASLDQFGFVGLVERFQDSLFLLSYIFGWKPIINTRKENAAKAKKAIEDLPASTLEVIKANSLLDIELYEYAREIFVSRFDQMVQQLRDQYTEHYINQQGWELPPAHQPLSLDQCSALLEQHYQQRYLDRNQPIVQSYVYDFDQPLMGMGWQRRECPEKMPTYRWTGPGTRSTLDLPVRASADKSKGKSDKDKAFLLEFRTLCNEITPADILNSLSVKVNGQPIVIQTLLGDQGTRFFQGEVPPGVVSDSQPFTRLEFEVDRVTSLNELNPLDPDTRPVGLAFNFVQLFPLSWKHRCSALLPFFDCDLWRSTTEFLQKYVEPEETIVAPLIFKVKLDTPVRDYASFFQSPDTNWVVIHKGKTDRLGTILLKLGVGGFAPVFANEVFVIFSRRSLPKLSYLSPHVKPLYVDRLKQVVDHQIKPRYRKLKHQVGNG